MCPMAEFLLLIAAVSYAAWATTFIAAVSYAASTGSSNCRFQIPGGNRTFDLSHLEGSHFEGADTTFGPNGGLFNVSLCGDLPGMLPQSGMCGPFPHARMHVANADPCRDALTGALINGSTFKYFGSKDTSPGTWVCWDVLARWTSGELELQC